ncbi:MAG: tetratricopeptide repeat-containing sensor histidine kinase, partial [Luteibaculum sp.]
MNKVFGPILFLLCTTLGMGQSRNDILEKASESLYSDLDRSLHICDSLLSISGLEAEFKAKALKIKGVAIYFKGKFEDATTLYLQALKIYDEKNDLAGKSAVLNELGTLQKKLGSLEKAKESFSEAKDYAQKARDTLLLATSCSNLGLVYSEEKKWDLALDQFRQSLDLKIAIEEWNHASYDLNNMAYVYAEQRNYNKAISYMEKSLALRQEHGNKRGVAISINNLGEMYLESGLEEKALSNFKDALQAARSIGFADLERHVLKMLMETHRKLGKYQEALTYYDAYSVLGDSLMSEQKLRQIEELQTQYETEKKDQEIALLNKESELQASIIRQNTVLIIALVVFLILLISLGLLWRQRYLAKQSAQIQAERIQLKQEQIKAVLESQEQERKRFASDLHDGMGQLISALKLHLNKWDKASNSNEIHKNESLGIIEEMQQDVRDMAFNLMPSILENQGLKAAVSTWINKLNRSGEITLHL